jgi:hypothetical protein
MFEMQFQVARGEKFCKAGRRIKNADALRKIGRGGERADWEFLGAGNSGLAVSLLTARLRWQALI